MALLLSDHEASPGPGGDYAATLALLQRRLARAQRALIAHRRRALILFEGWETSGRGGAIRRLVAGWDPRAVRVRSMGPPGEEERRHHYLWRIWAALPADGEIALLDRGWYRRVLADRAAGLVTRAEWRRAYDEINEFEAQQRDGGTTVVKLFFHISAAEQARRIAFDLGDPWRASVLTRDALHEHAHRGDYIEAIEEMLDKTDTRWAPWRVVDAGDRHHARLTALEHVATALEKAVPPVPPDPDPDTLRLARDLGLLPALSVR